MIGICAIDVVSLMVYRDLFSQECLKTCMRLVKGGVSVLFFPEGTRTTDGAMAAFKVGNFCSYFVFYLVCLRLFTMVQVFHGRLLSLFRVLM